jgi:hypothetical protein
MAAGDLHAIVVRSYFDEPVDLASFIAENRNKMSRDKLAAAAGLSLHDLRRLSYDRSFRQLVSEVLALHVLDIDSEARILQRFKEDAQEARTVWERRAAAEYLDAKGGLERAKEANINHRATVAVSFTVDTPETGTWRPPDPMAGVIGAPRDAPALPATAEGAPAGDAAQASEERPRTLTIEAGRERARVLSEGEAGA